MAQLNENDIESVLDEVQEQYLPDKETQDGVIMNGQSELNETQKLQLAERANEIYRQQLIYLQDHLASLRSLIQDKENIIENLMLRYDLGIITQDQNSIGGNLGPDEIEMEELRRKAEALAQRTILENFELREMVNELRDENFHLRNEIYENQDKINQQVLQIKKLEKNAYGLKPIESELAEIDLHDDVIAANHNNDSAKYIDVEDDHDSEEKSNDSVENVDDTQFAISSVHENDDDDDPTKQDVDEQSNDSIKDLGDMHIIPHDYLDNLLEEAGAHHTRKESRINHVQDRLQKHLPQPVAAAVAETLVQEDTNNEDTNDLIGRDRDVLDEIETIDPYLQPNVNIHNTALLKADEILCTKHQNIVNEWNENTTKLEKMVSFNDKTRKNDDETDEKMTQKEDTFSIQLLDKYTECLSIIDEQTNRLNIVTTDEYLVELILRQQELSTSMEEQESNLKVEQDVNAKTIQEYEILKQQRTELQQEIIEIVARCNEIIDRENSLFTQVKQAKMTMDAMYKKIESLKTSSNACISTIKLYNDFMDRNKTFLQKVIINFDTLWSEFESQWMQWKVIDVMVWFKYETIEMSTDHIEWQKIENEMKARNISGKSLVKFNELTFEFIGLKDFEIISHLVSQIVILKAKYTNIQSKVVDGKKENTQANIPERFICAITKQIMRDPVMAFDGHSYERSAIDNYLKQNNKSPVTGAHADYIILFPNHALKVEIEKYMQENNIKQELQNEGVEEGNETVHL